MAGGVRPLPGADAASEGPAQVRRFSELGRRTVVAVVLLPLVAGTIVAGPRSSGVLFGIAAALGCSEYYRLTLGSLPSVAWTGIIAAAVMPPLIAVLGTERAAPVLFGIVAVASNVSWVMHLFGGPRAAAPERTGHILAGLLFSAVGLVTLSSLRVGGDGVAWTAVVLVGAWANDAAAYLGGRAFGRKKFWPAISPHKTWEGFFAGLLGTIVGLLAIRPWLPHYLGIPACITLGMLIGVVGPVGDLCKSMLKRAYHVKDSGRLFPGHGGMLDRIDSVLFVSPVIAVVRTIWFPG